MGVWRMSWLSNDLGVSEPNIINTYRPFTRGNYATSFKNLDEGYDFPNLETRGRNSVYKFNKKLFTGEYCQNKKLVALIDSLYQNINYKVLPLNYFKLIVDKSDSLLFGNEIVIKSGDIKRDELINQLVDRTGWISSIREAYKLCQIYGDSCLKTYRNGVQAFPPTFAYKVVDEQDKKKVKGYVLHELLYTVEGTKNNEVYKPTHIRLLISCDGFDFERVFEYFGDENSGRLGRPVRFKYKDRWIPRRGRYYKTDLDVSTVQWLSVNVENDGVYGTSQFNNIKDLVFALENRLSTENWIIDAHGKPMLVVGMSQLKTDEITGDYYLSVINGKYMVQRGGSDVEPHYIEWDGKLDASRNVREDLMSQFYELSEMGKTFLSGEYTGNISEESLNNIIKSAIDRGNRELNDIYPQLIKSLYVLCRLNDIDVKIDDLTIEFNVGRADDDKVVAEVSGLLVEQGILSRRTILGRYFGLNDDQADAELERIKQEQTGGFGNDSNGAVETVIRE